MWEGVDFFYVKFVVVDLEVVVVIYFNNMRRVICVLEILYMFGKIMF